MPMPGTDRRREPRFPAGGSVKLIVSEPTPHTFTASLVDRSQHGFRVTHDYTGLPSGQEVQFEHSSGDGRAKVMWTRIVEERVESGFLVL